MKNWKIILWLILFFPIGLYLMYRYTDWSKPVKVAITAFFLLFLIIGGIDLIYLLFVFGSLIFTALGLITFYRTSNKKKTIALVATGFLFSIASYQIGEAQEAKWIAIEQQAREEQERIAEEEKKQIEEAERQKAEEEKQRAEKKRQQELARKKEQEKLKRQEEQLRKATEAIEKVEEESNQQNYDRAKKLLDDLEEEDLDLIIRLETTKLAVDEYEAAKSVAIEALEHAETEKSRTTYDEAYTLIAALAIPNESLKNRVNTLEQEITQIEKEERIAAEKKAEEEKRIAAEQARIAEEKRVEEEKARVAEQERVAAEQAAAQQAAQQPVAVQTPAPPVNNVEKVVYIAPYSGTKYHYNPNCRGLSNANSIQEISLSEAQSLGYGLCGWED